MSFDLLSFTTRRLLSRQRPASVWRHPDAQGAAPPRPTRPGPGLLVRLLAGLLLLSPLSLQAAPDSFEAAKIEARRFVYFDRARQGDFYCGCNWRWMGRSGGQVDPESCGYEVRRQPVRAARTEWEHVVPAAHFGQARRCWQNGGREACTSGDPVFGRMEADLFNLVPAVGEVNGDRQNFSFGMLPQADAPYGACPVRIDFRQRVVEPGDAVKGEIARIYFYMADRYDLRLSRQQQQLFMAWDRLFPVSEWEVERNRRIALRMGHDNPFVTGTRSWSLGYRARAEGLPADEKTLRVARARAESAPGSEAGDTVPVAASRQDVEVEVAVAPVVHSRTDEPAAAVVRANRRSRVYHLAEGCPGYTRLSPQNTEEFASEAEAQAAGFRKAGNCH